MQENSLEEKILNVGSDTIMAAANDMTQESKEALENLQEAVESSKEMNQAAIGNADIANMIYARPRHIHPLQKDNKIRRNDPCPCGALDENGKPKKYKNCCLSTGRYETYSRK